jgi:hypothetical protein
LGLLILILKAVWYYSQLSIVFLGREGERVLSCWWRRIGALGLVFDLAGGGFGGEGGAG